MELLDSINEYLKNNSNDDFFRLYPFATENINGYTHLFGLRGKSLLTVGSSCDQVINASLEGCYDITVCDICPLTKCFFYLKLSSLLVLEREEFLDFLCRTKFQDSREYNPHLLTKKTFNRIKHTLKSLDYDSYFIWEYLFAHYNRSELEKLFRNDINSLESIIYCNKYLFSDYNYNLVRKTIMNTLISFINGDISNLKSERKFDSIWFSNVAQYLTFEKVIAMVNNGINALNPEGKILLCYFWNTSMMVKGFSIEAFHNIQASKIIIPGISEHESENSVLIYDNKCSLIKK